MFLTFLLNNVLFGMWTSKKCGTWKADKKTLSEKTIHPEGVNIRIMGVSAKMQMEKFCSC